MAHFMLSRKRIAGFLLVTIIAALAALCCQAQDGAFQRADKAKPGEQDTAANAVVPHAAEDISGMYSFLKDGEFLQITLEKNEVTGYISRMGDSESDHGVFLDQFFSRADIQGHEVSFTTRPLHSMWYEFQGKFDRGPGKAKTDDGYYILRGTLKEFTMNDSKSVSERSRSVEFKLLAQPDDSDLAAPPDLKKPKS